MSLGYWPKGRDCKTILFMLTMVFIKFKKRGIMATGDIKRPFNTSPGASDVETYTDVGGGSVEIKRKLPNGGYETSWVECNFDEIENPLNDYGYRN